MTYLLTCYRKHINLYSPDTYGHETWGSSEQDSIIRKRKNWYFNSWSAGYGEFYDDREIEVKMDVILETRDLFSIIAYVECHYPEQLTYILEQALEISSVSDQIKESVKKCYENCR